ncbi:MAG: hypothetical protein SNH99_02150 [Rikenellaceae bacterium]
MKNYLLLLIFILSTLSATASWHPPIVNYSTKSSLVGKQNWKISQNPNGWIYFANNDGLLEFNGLEWSLYKLDNHSIVRSVECTSNGRIYVGGNNEIGYFTPDEMGRLTYTNLLHSIPENARSFTDIWRIHSVNERIYFQHRAGVYILDRYGDISHLQSEGFITASCVVNNSVYFSTNKGLYVIGDTDTIEIGVDYHLPYDQICAMVPFGEHESEFLIATHFDGLYLCNRGHITPFRTDKDELLGENQIYSIAVGRNRIACGTVRGGVVIMDLDGRNGEQFNLKSGLDNNTVLSLLFDNHNNLWCGLDNGLDCIELITPLRHSDTNREFRFSGYTTLLDSEYLYVGTNQGLMRMSNGQVLSKTVDEIQSIDNSEGRVWHLQMVDGTIYCSHNRGLFELVEEANKAPRLQKIYGGDGVWRVNKVAPNRMIAGTYEGLIRIDKSGDGYSVERIEGCGGAVRDLLYIPPLRMGFYISELGLERLQFDSDFRKVSKVRLLNSVTFDLKLVVVEGQIILYSPQQIYRINDDGALHETNQYNHLFELGQLYSMIEVDEADNIWYVADNSLKIRRYNPSRKQYSDKSEVLFTNRDLFLHGFTRIQPFNDRYRILNNINGFSIVDSEWREEVREDVKPLIVGIYDTNNGDSILMSGAYGVELKSITLPHSQNSFQIVYGCNAIDKQSLQYSYILEGSDQDWSVWSQGDSEVLRRRDNIKEYTRLFEGRYTFHLRVKDDMGRIESCSLEIVVLPPWQRSIGMYLLYFVVFVSIVSYTTHRVMLANSEHLRLVELQSEHQIEQQKRRFESLALEQENSIMRLEQEKLEQEVQMKSSELSALLLNKLEKNDIITTAKTDLEKIRVEAVNRQYENILKRVATLNRRLDDKMIDNIDWGLFEENFNIANNNFVQRIGECYSWMTTNERKLCVYIKMGLQNKEISPLLNLSVRGVEMLRYRLRKRLDLDRNENLYEFFQRLSE